ncbi:MAG: hypothetical protein M3O82_09920 [Verrucomicrobiota bacterium]|nr:hypothetical protein [Verrucomicrobiota bacterium]
MAIKHETTEQHGHIVDRLTDPETGIRIAVARAGAELVSLARRQLDHWTGFLYRDDDLSTPASGWKNHSTVMGYYTHRIKNERSLYRGHEIRGSTHSFLRLKTFAAPTFSADRNSLTYHLAPESIEPHEYPLRVAFALEYALREDTLRVTFRFHNEEPGLVAHVSFGLHPGFAATSLDSFEVLMPPGRYIQHFAPGNFLSGETAEIDFEGGPMPFRKDELLKSFLLEMKDVPVPIFVLSDRESRRTVDLNFTGAPFVTLWSDGHPFVCVEPCWGLPDHHEQRPFEKKAGIEEIAPGATLERSITMAPRLL